MPTATWGRPVSGPDRSRPGRGALGSAGRGGGRGLHTSKLWPCHTVLLTGRGRSSSHPAAAGDPTPVRAQGASRSAAPTPGPSGPSGSPARAPCPGRVPWRSETPARSGRSPAPSAPEPSAARVVRRLPQPPGRCERPTRPRQRRQPALPTPDRLSPPLRACGASSLSVRTSLHAPDTPAEVFPGPETRPEVCSDGDRCLGTQGGLRPTVTSYDAKQ